MNDVSYWERDANVGNHIRVYTAFCCTIDSANKDTLRREIEACSNFFPEDKLFPTSETRVPLSQDNGADNEVSDSEDNWEMSDSSQSS